MRILERLRQDKMMTTQQDVYEFVLISKNTKKLIAIDLSKQQKLDADPKAVQQINFTGNINRFNNVFHY